ncbi:GTP cyclohydrolase FolE2 [Halomonas salifodinae]|uniref:GTP cyclohydrolase FolE2 n=1 Tax=Halomonas salifodinae TaxID=438745 RepID=UPI0033A31372
MTRSPLADIAAERGRHLGTLSWVGMEGIALPLSVAGQSINGWADAGVSLDEPSARGIHMSRLYLALEALEAEPLTPAAVEAVLSRFLASHDGLSRRAFLSLSGDALLRRPALVSPLAGWKAYPFRLEARLDARGLSLELALTIGYSSTCPCSAALARQLIQTQFQEAFGAGEVSAEAVRTWLGSAQGIVATPHSQRSQAHLRLRLAEGCEALPLEALVERAERALGTALQTAVKRADEQAFALANGQNLMFCEDAARRLDDALREAPGVAGFRLRVVHGESLHAHDAVARSEWRWEAA